MLYCAFKGMSSKGTVSSSTVASAPTEMFNTAEASQLPPSYDQVVHNSAPQGIVVAGQPQSVVQRKVSLMF